MGRLKGFRVGAAAGLLALCAMIGAAVPAGAIPAGTLTNFTLIGHDNLFMRGENAAGTIYDHYEYIGNRTDANPIHQHPGVVIEDIGDPAHPKSVGEISQPLMLTLGYSSRELRVWPQQKLLMVLYIPCDASLHGCSFPSEGAGGLFAAIINFFDLTDPANPKLVQTYTPSVTPHEMFLWVDPAQPAGRALLYFTSPNAGGTPSAPGKSLVIADISKWRDGNFPEIATFDAVPYFSSAQTSGYDVRLHSISVSPDGKTTYFAHLGGGVLVVDSSEVAAGGSNPKLHLITPIAGRAYWDNQGAHSVVKVPGRPYIFSTEEIYGTFLVANAAFGPALGGCPWGWARLIDISNPQKLKIVSEFKTPENQQSFCGTRVNVPAPFFPFVISPSLQDNFSSYASHNPTLLPHLALATWHSNGLQAVDISDPTHPTSAGVFVPTPDSLILTPDPALQPGSNDVIAWSYPIIRNGLIYFVDIRNGLWIVKYTGPHASEVNGVSFLEGNSNLGDAAALESGAMQPANAPCLGPACGGVLPNTAIMGIELRFVIIGTVLIVLLVYYFVIRPRRS